MELIAISELFAAELIVPEVEVVVVINAGFQLELNCDVALSRIVTSRDQTRPCSQGQVPFEYKDYK